MQRCFTLLYRAPLSTDMAESTYGMHIDTRCVLRCDISTSSEAGAPQGDTLHTEAPLNESNPRGLPMALRSAGHEAMRSGYLVPE